MLPSRSFLTLYGLGVILALLVGCCFGLAFFFLHEHAAQNLNRIGIFFELLGLASVVPELINEEKMKSVEVKLRGVRVGRLQKRLDDYLSSRDLSILFDVDLSSVTGCISIISNVIMSFFIIVLWLNWARSFVPLRRIPGEVGPALAGVIAFLWIVLLLWILLSDRRGKAPSKVILWAFLGVHILVSVASLPLQAIIALSLKQVLRVAIPLRSMPIKQVVAWITLPLLGLGALLQLVSTFLPQ